MDAAQGSGSGGGGLHLAQAAAVEADLTNCGAVVDSLDRHLRLWSEGHYCSCEAGEVQQWLAEAARQMGELYAAAARLQAAGLFAPAAELMGKIAVAVQMTDTVRGELAGTGATGPAATQELVVDVGHGPCHVRVTDIPAGHTGDQCGRCGAFADGRPDQNGRHFCHECWFVSGCEQRTQNAAAAIAAHPVVIFGGDDTKPKYRELLLQPTGTWANERPVWSTPNGGGMHLYAMQDGTWCLNTSLQPDTTCHIAHTATAELTGRVTWQLKRRIRATPDSSSESVLMVVTGAEADSCAAQAEAAAAVIATHPIVVCGGDGYVKKKYRDILLLPTDKNANGRPVWSTEGGGLHLYRMADGDWCLNQTFQPDERFAMAHIRDSFSASPPAGEALWQVGRDLCDLEKLGAGADTHWATGALVLVTGAEAAAHAARHKATEDARLAAAMQDLAQQVGAPHCSSSSRATSLSLARLRPDVGVFSLLTALATCCGLWRQPQADAAWAAAAQVVLSGAAGVNASWVNGRFEQVNREVYRQVGDPDPWWLFVNSNGTWWVSNTAGKDARKTGSNGWAHSVAPAGGMPPAAGAGRWQVFHGGRWVEQTVEVELLDAAQVREWAARQAQQVSAPPLIPLPPSALSCHDAPVFRSCLCAFCGVATHRVATHCPV